MNIAILSPNKNAYSETFIQVHKNKLDGKIFFYYGEYEFDSLEGEGLIAAGGKLERLFIRAASKKIYGLTPGQTWLMRSFRKHKIDIVLAEYGVSGVKVLPVCKKLGIPMVVHFHGYDAHMHRITEAFGEQYKAMFQFSAGIIAVSTRMRSQLIHLGCPEEKLHLCVYGPDDAFLSMQRTPSRAKFIGLGRFVDKKAPYYLVLAFQQVVKEYPDAVLTMGGDGPLFETCRNMVRAMGLEKNILLPGKLTPEEFRNHLVSAAAFVQHSITSMDGDSEGTPVAVLEAMAASVPVISTLHAGIADVMVNGETGFLVEEHDVNGMAKRICELVERPAEVMKMGEKGRRRIQDFYTMDMHIEKLNIIIRKSLSQH